MPKKTIVGEFEGQRFSLENTWFSGAKLFHGSELIATCNQLFVVDKDSPIMTARVMIGQKERIVEAFAYALLTVKLQIRVDGNKIAGDDF